jgi:chemotaxis protein methyltransferase WspC
VTLVDFESLLKQTMGLDAVSVGSSTIERAVRLRMTAHGLEQRDDYWRQLKDSNDELQHLIEAVVVPETWFFRDQQAFAVLAGLVMEEWRPSHPNSTLRLLSIPCSTGEESYSMAMALLDAGLAPTEFQIDAVDISTTALARAKRGAYGMNSFRGEDFTFRERYFQATASGYDLAERIRNQVNFRRGNILSDDFCLSKEPFDVIFCRNLLIYFDRPTQEQVMTTLGRLLSNSGFLFVGPAEAFLAGGNGFTSVNRPMSFAFRKTRKQNVKAVVEGRPASVQLFQKPLAAPMPRPIPAKSRSVSVQTSVQTSAPSLVHDLETARRLADAGRLREAVECCENHLKQGEPTSEAYYLLGLVRDAGGDQNNAAECYRKVLYLEPDHPQALLHLALLIEAQGDIATAARFRERARRVEACRKDEKS